MSAAAGAVAEDGGVAAVGAARDDVEETAEVAVQVGRVAAGRAAQDDVRVAVVGAAPADVAMAAGWTALSGGVAAKRATRVVSRDTGGGAGATADKTVQKVDETSAGVEGGTERRKSEALQVAGQSVFWEVRFRRAGATYLGT